MGSSAWAPGAQGRARGPGAEGGPRWPGQGRGAGGRRTRRAPRGPGGVGGGRAVEPGTQEKEKARRGGGSRKPGVRPRGRRRSPQGNSGSGGRLPGRAEGAGWEGHSQISWICRRRRPPRAARPGSGPSSCPGSRGRAPGPLRAAPCPGSRRPVTPRPHRSHRQRPARSRRRRRPAAQPAAAPRLISMQAARAS